MQDPVPLLSVPNGPASSPKWLEYVYRTVHPALRWLPTKLAESIGENLQEELGFPDKADQRAQPGTGWTPAELNSILQDHVVDGALTTLGCGCVEWESELFRCTMRARCYPFDMPKRRFHSFNPKVTYHDHVAIYQYIPSSSPYILVHTFTYCSCTLFLCARYHSSRPTLSLLPGGGSPQCTLGRLLVCPSRALLHLPSASKGWPIAENPDLQNRP